MPEGILRFNPDRALVEAELPDGTEYGPTEPQELMVFADGDEPDNAYLAVLTDDYEGLQQNTLYKLVAVTTLVEEDVDLTEEEEEDDDGAEEPEGGGEPT